MDPNMTNSSCSTCNDPDAAKGFTLVVIFIMSLIGNAGTIIIIGKLKEKRIPDILIICLAIADLTSTVVPIPMSIYSYFSGMNFALDSPACGVFGIFAQWSRYSAAIMVTLISIDRYLAIAFPVFYSQRVKLWHMVIAILCCICLSTTLAFIPLAPDIVILPGDGICLFSFLSTAYASIIIVYAGVQFIIVLYCFTSTSYLLCRIWWRRRKMNRQGKRNVMSNAKYATGPTFSKPGIQGRFNDLNLAFKRVAPKITESLSLSIEAQFARMLLCITILFYLTWLPTVILIVYALATGDESGYDQREALFWAIRFTVISTAINPILYGILCRQYRQLYLYIFRLIFSRCCDCLHEPYYSPFAHRDQPPKLAEEKMRRAKQKPREYVRYYGSYRSFQSFYSQMSRSSSRQTALTRATTHINISLPHLAGINEEEYLASTKETSVHVDTAGTIESTVVIPESARDGAKHSETVVPARAQSYGEGIDASETYFNARNTSMMENGDIHRTNPGYSSGHESDVTDQSSTQSDSSKSLSEVEDDDNANFVWVTPASPTEEADMKRNYGKEEMELLGRTVDDESNLEGNDLESEYEDEESSSVQSETEGEKELYDTEGDDEAGDLDNVVPNPFAEVPKSPTEPIKAVYDFDKQFEQFEFMIQDAAKGLN